ncbi:MAG: hypothetical protein COA78_31345 [Blastopirellula sp.]|nr:MAG: hypothetical protein COA78_31345 [Blastopirellula sp.]
MDSIDNLMEQNNNSVSKKLKHYRCESCRNIAVVERDKANKPFRCQKCNTFIDEHDEIVRWVRPMIPPTTGVC